MRRLGWFQGIVDIIADGHEWRELGRERTGCFDARAREKRTLAAGYPSAASDLITAEQKLNIAVLRT